jgi:hypothetical protein
MSSIPLDVNSDNPLGVMMTTCPVCGGTGEELVLAGKSNVYQCSCGRKIIAYAGQAHRVSCPCGNTYRRHRGQFTKLHKLDTSWSSKDKVLASGPCNKCEQEAKEKMEQCKAEVARGGIFWACSVCKSEGALKAEHPLAVDVRAKMIKSGDIKPPVDGKHQPCGIDLGKFNLCPICEEAAQAGKKEAANDTH